MKFGFIQKTLVASCILMAANTQALADKLPDFAALDYVPAETTFFSAAVEPFPLKSYLSVNQASLKTSVSAQLAGLFAHKNSSEAKFIKSLLNGFVSSIDDLPALLTSYGLADEVRMLAYAVDFHPIFKIEIADSNAVWQHLAKAESESGIKAVAHSVGDVDYKSYILQLSPKNRVELIVSTNDQWLTIALKKPTTNAGYLSVALAATKPQTALNQTEILQKMVDEYGFDGQQLGFVNHKKLATAVVNGRGSQFIGKSQMAFQTAECRTDLAMMANVWPRTVTGTTALNIDKNQYKAQMKTIIEVNDTAIMTTLMGLRGHIPNHVSGQVEQALSVALGLDAATMAPILGGVWKQLISLKLNCKPLVAWQKKLKKYNPALLSAFAGVATGVKGISASLFGLRDAVDTTPKTSLDVLVSLATENSAEQLLLASMFLPTLRNAQLLDDDSELNLNDYLSIVGVVGDEVKAATAGEHLNLYQGETSKLVSQSMQSEAIETNGFFEIYIDYIPLSGIHNQFQPFSNAMERVVEFAGSAMPNQFGSVSKLDGSLDIKVDFVEQGIELLSEVKINK